MRFTATLWVAFIGVVLAAADTSAPQPSSAQASASGQSTTSSFPAQQPQLQPQPQQQTPSASYVAQTYSAAPSPQDAVQQYVQQGAYGPGPVVPYGYADSPYVQTGYESYLAPAAYPVQGYENTVPYDFTTSVLPVIKRGTQVLLRLAGRLGLFVLGGAGVVFLGGLLTTAICTFTPICTITFAGFGVTKETMRSLMTPEKVSAAANFVQDALDKYQRMQRASML